MTSQPRPRTHQPTRGRPPAVRLPGRARTVLASLAASIGLLAVLAGVPVVLTTVAGPPVPDHVPTWTEIRAALLTRDDGQLFLATLHYLAWAAWVLLLLTLLLEVVAQFRHRPTPRIPGLGLVQWLARVLVTGLTAVVLTTPTGLARSTTPPPPLPTATAPPPASHTSVTDGPVGDGTPTAGSATAATVQPAAQQRPSPRGKHHVYVVKPRDTLWGIAERFLGDGELYGEIARLNYGRPQSDGHALTSSHWLNPGWQLILPTDAQLPEHRHGDEHDGRRWYIVQPGDTLTSIAADQLGDPDRYDEIARLNHRRVQPDSGTLTNPDHVRPGWRLLLPATTRPGSHHDDESPPARPDRPADGDRTSPPPSGAPSGTPSDPSSTPSNTPPPRTEPPTTTPPPSTAPTRTASGQPTDRATPSTVADAPTTSAPTPTPTHRAPVITLPSGMLASGTLAFAVGAAITLLHLRRRARYRPLTDQPTAPNGPETSPTPRRMRRAYMTGLEDDTDDEDTAIAHGYARRNKTAGSGVAEVPFAARDGNELTVALPTLGGLGLHGPGADAAARALLTTLLEAGTSQIVTTSTDLTRLLQTGGATDDATDDDGTSKDVSGLSLPPGVIVKATVHAAIEHIETDLLHRSRLLTSHDAPDLESLHRDHPDEPISTLVLLTSVPDELARRLAGALSLAASHHLGAILLGRWPHGTTCHLDTDGHATSSTGPGSAQFTQARFFQLPAADANDMLAVLAAAITPNPDPRTEADEKNGHRDPPRGENVPVGTGSTSSASDALVQLHVLGPVIVATNGVEIATGLRTKARELLAYLAAHPDGITLDQAITDCWSDVDADRAANQFRTVTDNIRATLRDATGDRHAKFVTYTAGRYRLDPKTATVDLWRFTHCLHLGADPDDSQSSIEALTRPVAEYGGTFTDTCGYAWAEHLRESLHRHAIDAHVRLADEYHRREDVEHAYTTLESALELDPYNEDLYRRAIGYLGELGRTEAIRRLYQQLQNRLADLDLDPDPATEQLVAAVARTHEPNP